MHSITPTNPIITICKLRKQYGWCISLVITDIEMIRSWDEKREAQPGCLKSSYSLTLK